MAKKKYEMKGGNTSTALRSESKSKPRKRKTKKTEAQVDLRKYLMERKPIWLTRSEVQWVIELVSQFKCPEPVLAQLHHILQSFEDDAIRFEEMSARASANSFWQEPESWARALEKYLRSRRKKKLEKTKEAVPHLPPKEMKKLLDKEKTVADANKRGRKGASRKKPKG